jgi:hypothetical protein
MKSTILFIFFLISGSLLSQLHYKTFLTSEPYLLGLESVFENGKLYLPIRVDYNSTKPIYNMIIVSKELDSIKYFGLNNKYTNDLAITINDTVYSVRRHHNDSLQWVEFIISKHTSSGVKFFERTYPILPYEYVGKCTNQSAQPIIYGLTALPTGQIILYGEGMDKRLSYPGGPCYQTFLLRYYIRSDSVGDLIWYEPGPSRFKRVGVGKSDIDGRFIFSQQYDHLMQYSIYNYINKLNDDNTISTLTKVNIRDSDNRAIFDIDSLGNFFMNCGKWGSEIQEQYSFGGYMPTVAKIDRKTNIEKYRVEIPPYYAKLPNDLLDSPTSQMYIWNIQSLKNGDVLVIGRFTHHGNFYIKSKNMTEERWVSSSWIARLDSLGHKKWAHYALLEDESGPLAFSIGKFYEMDNGDLLFSASKAKKSVDGLIINSDLAILVGRLNSEGCFDDDCSHVGKYFWTLPSLISGTNEHSPMLDIILYPNPASEKLSLSVPENAQFPLRYEITDISGRKIEYSEVISPSNVIEIAVDQYQPSIYILTLVDNKGQGWQSKWVKE